MLFWVSDNVAIITKPGRDVCIWLPHPKWIYWAVASKTGGRDVLEKYYEQYDRTQWNMAVMALHEAFCGCMVQKQFTSWVGCIETL
jgi:hypothetical protein